MIRTAIVVIGYDRADSILRLLKSLDQAKYDGNEVPLIVSIDNSGSNAVENAVKAFEWKHGTKVIRTFSERQGLKKHILSCGDFLEKYDAIFVFEDDIFVSPYFYRYGMKSIEFYAHNDKIEGISLYSPKWNTNANFPFSPLRMEGDTFFMQYAPSLGQIWLKDKWQKFKEWYEQNEDFFDKSQYIDLPANLYHWGKHSWKKYYIAYCALFGKYFVYPYNSFTTAFVDQSLHFFDSLTRFQVELKMDDVEYFKLSEFRDVSIRYDAFFESMNVANWLDIDKENIDVDLYGCKKSKSNKQYILSSQVLPYKIEKTFAMQLRPIELNVLMNLEGSGLYLYDSSILDKAKRKERRNPVVQKWNYFFKERFLTLEEILPVSMQKFTNIYHIIVFKFKNLFR